MSSGSAAFCPRREGIPPASFNLGKLLELRRFDFDAAEAAYRRAEARTHPRLRGRRNLLYKKKDFDGAEASYRRAQELGDSDGAYLLELMLKRRHLQEGVGERGPTGGRGPRLHSRRRAARSILNRRGVPLPAA